jgi:hypothetical protein
MYQNFQTISLQFTIIIFTSKYRYKHITTTISDCYPPKPKTTQKEQGLIKLTFFNWLKLINHCFKYLINQSHCY